MQNTTLFKFRCSIKPSTKKALKAHCGINGETIKTVAHKLMQGYIDNPCKIDAVKYATGSKNVTDFMAIVDAELYKQFRAACDKLGMPATTVIEKGLRDYLKIGQK